ncbi:uncharacterized protein LOC109788773 [Cajanus cajan]|uniref:uncharacterized protein LOC109788773 n=1 Tax=Cajanus cajan TaxID=3821 RepID=UPI00098DCAA7|nr:uncharacterized protein LOC109788773 [Cajanus cajan]
MASFKKLLVSSSKKFLLDPGGMILDLGGRLKPYEGKMTSQLQDKSTGCNLNKYEEVGEPFSPEKNKKTVERVSSFMTTKIVFLLIIFDIYTHSSIMQLQPFHKQQGHVFIWFSLVEMLGFMMFVWGIAAMIAVGAPFSRVQCAMFMFWAILMLLRSAKSITQVYVPIFGILFTMCYMLVKKEPSHEG